MWHLALSSLYYLLKRLFFTQKNSRTHQADCQLPQLNSRKDRCLSSMQPRFSAKMAVPKRKKPISQL
jgi:hypothetical protein